MKNVLIVDDVSSMLRILERVVTLLGHQPTIASCGAEALEKVKELTFDLCLIDFHMPGIDGIELTKEIRKLDNYENIPIVMVSSEPDRGQQKMARQAGCTRWITKPFEQSIVKSTVIEFIGGNENT